MRSCEKLLDNLKNNHIDEYKYLVKKCFETDEQGNRVFFVGFRRDYLELYYKGMCAFKLTEKEGNTIYETDRYYVEDDDSKKEMTFDVLQDSFETICRQIKKHVSGGHDRKKRREKICQQWLMNGANQVLDDWYYIDMEYIDKTNPCGRFDMIAINRKLNKERKHDVALIELKVTNRSFKGLNGKTYGEKKEEYEELSKNLYIAKHRKVKYGSGVVSHIADFLRYLYNTASYTNQLRHELVEMIKSNIELGIIDPQNPLYGVNTVDMISDKPQIYIVSYSYTPSLDGDKDTKSEVKSMKRSFYKYLYDSDYSLENMLNPSQIEGILNEKDSFKEFIKDDTRRKICIKEKVRGEEYIFNIAFVDPDEDNPLVCIF
ncbi:hypothetical protein D081_1256 [Anaerovibrio sp. JC8]|uniref:hypothetical protein n=1 Tax=Anaerovibrio sp. JC8 TaxID=1240085 RepID=UPI000A0EC430|nr:hypothetical protein [Anaerovibrio sp. JC8]ORU00162.1 hypothetical protein D081_1256 [Anaerovibrio sp. JC8]